MAARRGCRAYPLLLDDHERLSCVVDRSLSMPHAGIERALQTIDRVPSRASRPKLLTTTYRIPIIASLHRRSDRSC